MDIKNRTKYEEWIGTDVYDSAGDKMGDITNIFFDDVTGQPEWMTVSTGWMGTKEQFVPISGTANHEDGFTVPYATDVVKDAPSIDTDQEHLDADEERRLFEHYGLNPDGPDHEATYLGRERADEGYDYNDTRDVADDGVAAVTRSEEQLAVDKVAVESGRVRVRKYVVTDDVEVTVPVKRQVARIVREPATGAGIIEGDAVEEVVLAEEQVIVDKEVVAKETIGIETETVVGNETVSETVRKEKVEIDGDVAPEVK